MIDPYSDLTTRLGVTRCRGIESSGHYCPHRHDLEGSVSPDGTIHFSHRDWPRTRAGTLAFLKLVARSQDPSLDMDVPWRRVYRLNMAVRDLAHRLHIQNPAHPGHADRAFVLAAVAGMSNAIPMRKQAYDWARRGPKRKEP